MNTKIIALAVVAVLATGGRADAQQTKRPTSGYLGFAFREELTLPSGEGSKLVIGEVSKDSPAEKAGVKAGDEILRINGLAASNGKFTALSRTLVVGDTVRLRLLRSGKEQDVTIVAAPRPAGYGMMRSREIIIAPDSVRKMMKIYLDSARVHLDSLHLPNFRIFMGDSGETEVHMMPFGDSTYFKRDSTFTYRVRPGEPNYLPRELGPNMVFRSMELGSRSIGGAELAVLDPEMVDYFKTDKGLLVLHVAPETPADRAGLQPGDVIVKAKGRAVGRVDDLRSIVAANPESVKLEVLRKGAHKEIELKTRR